MDASENSFIKIVDFGFARRMPLDQQRMNSPCFTLQYAAPEVLRQTFLTNGDGYSEACDLWNLGVILVRMYFSVEYTCYELLAFTQYF